MFAVFAMTELLKVFDSPSVAPVESDTLLELVTEDGNMMAFEDGAVWGVETA
jgi:hypothetical protein